MTVTSSVVMIKQLAIPSHVVLSHTSVAYRFAVWSQPMYTRVTVTWGYCYMELMLHGVTVTWSDESKLLKGIHVCRSNTHPDMKSHVIERLATDHSQDFV